MAHFLVMGFPMHGHINPTLEFARRLAGAGARVTFLTTVSAYRRIIKSPAPDGLTYASFSDGHDDGFNFHIRNDSARVTVNRNDDHSNFAAHFREVGARKLSDLVRTLADEEMPVTCVVYSMLQFWVADVARQHDIPAFLLWTQPSTVFAVYYHYFHGYEKILEDHGNDPDFELKLPNMPLFSLQDLPSFLHPSDPHSDIRDHFRAQFEALDIEVKPRVLVNSFDELEPEAILSVDGVKMIGVGPLVQSTSKEGSGKSSYVEWLDSKPVASVVYVSFGSVISPCKKQIEEIFKGLVESQRPFLWVLRSPENVSDYDVEFHGEMRRRVGESEQGLVVHWCSQVEVLSHPSTGCFVTHNGWNSTLESLTLGVPMVCFPRWTDQTTNGKLVEDVWKTGVRVKVNEEGILESEELKRCLEIVMEGEEIKIKALRWKDLARDAVEEGGSSSQNITALMEEMTTGRNLS